MNYDEYLKANVNIYKATSDRSPVGQNCWSVKFYICVSFINYVKRDVELLTNWVGSSKELGIWERDHDDVYGVEEEGLEDWGKARMFKDVINERPPVFSDLEPNKTSPNSTEHFQSTMAFITHQLTNWAVLIFFHLSHRISNWIPSVSLLFHNVIKGVEHIENIKYSVVLLRIMRF